MLIILDTTFYFLSLSPFGGFCFLKKGKEADSTIKIRFVAWFCLFSLNKIALLLFPKRKYTLSVVPFVVLFPVALPFADQ